ncbi:drug resistance transporter, Bcr/CflA subfamily [Beutenbergia cavernae DSM 12333]|uniref:Drug resistance transporter, Bcr/CflA subfamily n=1 Tax=Beutenbergia cavernae (strain ATCC BAA-8 / DSM 12333 / CCUG 43141 / JCM 11478 / NBRC 16432 / NCIMB 13614 / HKI 0122) TaxID=471853 RepID=C5BVQ9_BEUC1|nr:multidrug effflux MFS transporter [Beutenbergia cavernae]ACQ78499.1 drug resistance transporter, Bcr/CflA subfamily [Beutenbergia cavernae DSM 12333]
MATPAPIAHLVESTPSRSGRIPAALVLLLSALTAVGPLTIDLYLAAFPDIATELGTSAATVQLTMTTTLIGLALGQLVIGSVSDALGRRRPLLAAFALYAVVSIAIAFVSSIGALAALRGVQGFAASAGMVMSMAIVRDRFSGPRVAKVIARLMLVVGVAPILAPTLGAQILRFGDWRTMFFVLAGVGAALLVLVALFLRESLPAQYRRTGGLGPALASYGSLLRDRSFVALALLAGFYMAAMFTYVSTSTFVFQEGYGLTAQQFALVFGAGAIAVTAGSQINGALAGRVTPERILSVVVPTGVVLSLLLVVVAATAGRTVDGLLPLVGVLVLVLGTAGFVMPSVPAIALERNAHQAGSAAALLGASQFGVGAAIAPVTGLFGEGDALTMALVMSGTILVAAGLLLVVARGWTREARAIPAPAPASDGVPSPAVAVAEAEAAVVAETA